jgi:hypothetical protein
MYDIGWPKLTTCEPERIHPGDVVYGRGEYLTQANTVENFELFREPMTIEGVAMSGRYFTFEGKSHSGDRPVRRTFSRSSFAIIEDKRKKVR